jgi:hypothetical protein
MPATYDDANLAMKLLTWSTGLGLMEAMNTLTQGGFDPASATTADPQVQAVLTFGETVGTFVKQGVLDEGLVKDLWWIEGMWERVGPAGRLLREQVGEPRLYENFERLARGNRTVSG